MTAIATDQKAYLEVENGTRIGCEFNPSELQLARSNSWKADSVPGKGAPELFFTGGSAGTLKVNLIFDTTGQGTPVTGYTNKLLDLMEIDTSLPGYDPETRNGRPPWVKFHWGDLHSFKAIIESLDIAFTYFSSSGMPLRAKANLALKQYEPDANWGPQNPTSGTPRPQRTHLVRSGETLDRIAATHYGDPTQWRVIATANGIIDPLDLEPGRVLSIPRIRG